jgi:hypothetical protein
MPMAMRIRNVSWPLRALSLVTLVALLVAPACAPLCAGQNCRRADASAATHGNCHEAGTLPHDALRVHAILSCGSQDLPAVLSAPVRIGEPSGVSRWGAPDGKFLAVELDNSASAVQFSDFYFGRPHNASSTFTPVPSGILRI